MASEMLGTRVFMGVVLAGILAVSASTSASAQQDKKSARAAKPEVGKLYGDWGIQCEMQTDKSQKCFAAQYQTRTETGQRVLNVNVGYLGPKGEPTVVSFVPLGIDLATGIALRIQPGPQIPLTVTTCVPEGCRAVATLESKDFEALRRAKTLVLLMIPHGEKQARSMAISVKGLAEAIAALK